MKLSKIFCSSLVSCLFLADVSWRVWAWHHYADYRALATQFKLEVLHTNDASGIGIFYAKTEQPIWTKFDFGNGVNESYYFRGHDVFDVTLSSNRPPKYGVFFRGTGKSVAWWLDRGGNGSFTERIFYDTNGVFFRHEIWYNEAWHLVDRRNETNGIVIDGQWHQLLFDTNHNWTIEAVSTNHY
jgi:hypothetical protein